MCWTVFYTVCWLCRPIVRRHKMIGPIAERAPWKIAETERMLSFFSPSREGSLCSQNSRERRKINKPFDLPKHVWTKGTVFPSDSSAEPEAWVTQVTLCLNMLYYPKALKVLQVQINALLISHFCPLSKPCVCPGLHQQAIGCSAQMAQAIRPRFSEVTSDLGCFHLRHLKGA